MIAFGSCRVAAPQEPPYTLQPEEHELGLGLDALHALALRLRDQDPAAWPRLLLMIGDQVLCRRGLTRDPLADPRASGR